MTQRLDYNAAAPAGMMAFNGVHGYVSQSGLPKALIDLVYLRVSLINGCAYCIDKHTHDLIEDGVDIAKIVLTPVWHEAGALFSDQEKAALRWAETVTNVAETAVPEADFQAARAAFSEKELADVTIAIGLMNAYNRLAISFRKTPAAAEKKD